MRRITQFRMLGASLALCAALACAGGMRITYAERRPPPDRMEVMVRSPGTDYVWVRGHWQWNRNDYGWVPGRWERVQRGYRTWVPGHWVERRNRWRWVEGHWAR